MDNYIAIFATSVNPSRCDFDTYDFRNQAKTIKRMDVIDGEWVTRHLTGERGEKAKIAEHLGIDPPKLARILNGERQVQPDEVPKLLEYFGYEIKPSNQGLAEDLNRVLSQAE
ncbi:MAG: helix-turn-helix transcriptional regulator, partial [Pseudomonadota bacterium]